MRRVTLALGSHIPAQGFDNLGVTLSPDETQLTYVGVFGSETMLYLRSMSWMRGQADSRHGRFPD
jgi:hypothetical protein